PPVERCMEFGAFFSSHRIGFCDGDLDLRAIRQVYWLIHDDPTALDAPAKYSHREIIARSQSLGLSVTLELPGAVTCLRRPRGRPCGGRCEGAGAHRSRRW